MNGGFPRVSVPAGHKAIKGAGGSQGIRAPGIAGA